MICEAAYALAHTESAFEQHTAHILQFLQDESEVLVEGPYNSHEVHENSISVNICVCLKATSVHTFSTELVLVSTELVPKICVLVTACPPAEPISIGVIPACSSSTCRWVIAESRGESKVLVLTN